MFDGQIDWRPDLRESAMTDVIEHLQATGEIVPAQMPSRSSWSPEKALAAATLASALVEIRDHFRTPSHRRLVEEDLEWLSSEAEDHPYSFERLCQLLEIDSSWVRTVVKRWCSASRRQRTACWRKAA